MNKMQNKKIKVEQPVEESFLPPCDCKDGSAGQKFQQHGYTMLVFQRWPVTKTFCAAHSLQIRAVEIGATPSSLPNSTIEALEWFILYTIIFVKVNNNLKMLI